jgi:hypothetical protein
MRRRQAFTIVELLVSMALIIFIMAILTEAFSAGLTTFRQLKAIGDMQERMRSVAIGLRRDLKWVAFEDPPGTPRRLSDLRLNLAAVGGVPGQQPPAAGYFRIWQQPSTGGPDPQTWNSTSEGYEGIAGGAIPSTRAVTHVLQFTTRLRGLDRDSYRTAAIPVPGQYPGLVPDPGLLWLQGPPAYQAIGTMNSQWYEATYFLKPTGEQAGTTLLYALYRRERVLSTTPNFSPVVPDGYPDVSRDPTSKQVNTPTDVTVPTRRFGMDSNVNNPWYAAGWPTGIPPNAPWTLADEMGGTTSVRAGDDLLMSDVLSFDVKVVQQGFPVPPGFVDLPAPNMNLNSAFSTNNFAVFDTWCRDAGRGYGTWAVPGTTTSLPLRMRVLAIQVTLRVWDFKTQQARQLSIVQDM